MQDDLWHMRTALGLARRGLGRVAPNPAVGCVIVKEGRVVGRGWTQPGGRPHAETEALAQAGDAAKGATAYVSLEPCAHHGETPPCAEALINAGISRCVVATRDPDPRVSGAGIAMLKGAGIEVHEDIGQAEAEALNAGFLMRIRSGRPIVTLKLATTLDGKIATANGHSQWITGPDARRYGHLLRVQHDAILTGVGTVLADDPMLDCRIAGLEHASPSRFVVDSSLRTPLASQLVETSNAVSTTLLTLASSDPSPFEAKGVTVLHINDTEDGRVGLPAALEMMGGQGVTRVLAECGAELATSLLRLDLVDRIAWFRAPSVIGGDGLAAVATLGLAEATQARRFVRQEQVSLGEDVLETYSRTAY